MILKTLFLIVLLSGSVLANDDWLDARKIESTTYINDKINIVQQGGYSELKFVRANLSWYPRENERQEVLEIYTDPMHVLQDKKMLFEWLSPQGEISYSVTGKTITNSDYSRVDRLIEFPITIDESLVKYTKPREIIDTNEDIEELAASLASGKNDLYEVVYTIAEYTRTNIEYNLTSITVDASQKSSWVLENKRGVCDELTSLFISMVRSLGIPAKFVSGISYSNLDSFDDPWQAHGWAEVYFPDVGWVPFDITYGEYGWLDATHIKLNEDVDALNRAAEYSARGKSFSFGQGEFDIDVTVTDYAGRHVPGIEVEIDPVWDSVSFGSYNVINVKVRNLQEYYVSDRLHFSNVKGLDLFLPESTTVLLKPLETKNYKYLARITPDLDKGFSYAFPVEMESDRGISAGSSFRVSFDSTYITKDVAEAEIESNTASEGFGNIDCSVNETFAYQGDNIGISCVTEADNVVCFQDDCKLRDYNFEFVAQTPGFKTYEVKLFRYGEQIGSNYFSLEVLNPANLKVENFSIAKTVSYGGNIPVKLKFSTAGIIKELEVKILHENFDVSQKLFDIEPGTHELTYMVDTGSLKPNANSVNYVVSYSDKKDSVAEQKGSVNFDMVDYPFYQGAYSWLQKTVRKLFN